jgi:hypothetical protein
MVWQGTCGQPGDTVRRPCHKKENMQSRLIFFIIFFLLLLFIAIWLFIQGLVNIITGKVTKFGFDAIMHIIDIKLKNNNNHWEDPKRARITGSLAILIAIEFGLSSINIFQDIIHPYLR